MPVSENYYKRIGFSKKAVIIQWNAWNVRLNESN